MVYIVSSSAYQRGQLTWLGMYDLGMPIFEDGMPILGWPTITPPCAVNVPQPVDLHRGFCGMGDLAHVAIDRDRSVHLRGWLAD